MSRTFFYLPAGILVAERKKSQLILKPSGQTTLTKRFRNWNQEQVAARYLSPPQSSSPGQGPFKSHWPVRRVSCLRLDRTSGDCIVVPAASEPGIQFAFGPSITDVTSLSVLHGSHAVGIPIHSSVQLVSSAPGPAPPSLGVESGVSVQI
jgi:hypothetical protein